MAGNGYNFHAERIVDGDASTPTDLILYDNGSTEVRTLLSTERLHITDILIITETAGDVALLADAAVGGEYLVFTKTAAGIPIQVHFNQPYICQAGVVPEFTGVSSNRNMCLIHGFIMEA